MGADGVDGHRGGASGSGGGSSGDTVPPRKKNSYNRELSFESRIDSKRHRCGGTHRQRTLNPAESFRNTARLSLQARRVQTAESELRCYKTDLLMTTTTRMAKMLRMPRMMLPFGCAGETTN